MMDVREKLMELLDIIIQPCQKTLGDIADYLISNGVTVQEWISVKDRLPEKDGQYLIFTTQYFTPDHIDGIEISGYSKRFGLLSKNGLYAKYWCKMPQPPKGE